VTLHAIKTLAIKTRAAGLLPLGAPLGSARAEDGDDAFRPMAEGGCAYLAK
jgi:hypothetical protein